MKKYFFALVTLFASLTFAIQKNPQIRNCVIAGGEFIVANTHKDQIGLCRFDKALIGALDFMYFNTKESIPLSVNSYMKDLKSCESNGEIETIIILGGESLQTCAYSDGSYIELGTLIKGQGSADNQKLNEVLGL